MPPNVEAEKAHKNEQRLAWNPISGIADLDNRGKNRAVENNSDRKGISEQGSRWKLDSHVDFGLDDDLSRREKTKIVTPKITTLCTAKIATYPIAGRPTKFEGLPNRRLQVA